MSNGICDTCRKFGKCDDTKNGRTTYCTWCHGYKPDKEKSDREFKKRMDECYKKMADEINEAMNKYQEELQLKWLDEFHEALIDALKKQKGQNNENIHKAESD